jgi:anti-sigma factor RsiW
MQTPERPFDGDLPDDGAPSYKWLDEWLCEYVDGTMDPSVEAVFEQYVEANPELKAHVRRLRQTRELLCGCDAPNACSADPQWEGREAEEALHEATAVRPKETEGRAAAVAGLVTSVAVALVVGFLAGSVLVDPATFSPAPTVSAVEKQTSPQETMREEAPPQRSAASTPAVRSQASSFSTGGSIVSRPAAVPTSGPDTMGIRSTLLTRGER